MYPRRFPAVRPIHPRSDQNPVLLKGEQAATKHRMSAGLRTDAKITDREMTSSVHFSAIAALGGVAAGIQATALRSHACHSARNTGPVPSANNRSGPF
jgi:hypothetical protein